MPLLRRRELKQMLPEELERRLDEFRAELVRLRTSVSAGGRVDNPSRIRELRRNIAKILTASSEKRRRE